MRSRGFRIVVLATLATIGWAGCGDSHESPPAELQPALGSISGEALEQHMRRLADDALGGRATGSVGYDAAADYVATKFTELGLEPAGNDGDFFQPVPLLRADANYDDTRLAVVGPSGRVGLEPEIDYVLPGDFLREAAELSAPLVYAGFGVVAAEESYDDYAGLDVRERIVVVSSGAPASFDNDIRAHFSSWREKARAAVARGALGLLVAHSEEDARRYPWERVVGQSRMGAMRWLREGGQPADAQPALFVEARMSQVGFEKLLDAAGQDAAEVLRRVRRGAPRGFELGVRLEARTAMRHQVLRSANVVARLAGSDPALAREHVVVSAHLDHLDARATASGDGEDRIFNGAYDNASGVAVLLEAARALASLERRPSRSVLFVALTAEEKGLLGSDYFVRHPTVPFESLVADVNIDMVLMLHPLADVIGFGAGHSTLAAPLERAAAQLGLGLSPDPYPAAAVFVRSDQYSFVRRGIPALFVVPGGQGGAAGGRDAVRWMREVYHTPADDMEQAFEFEAGAAFARLQTLLIWHIAEVPSRPEWNPKDFFSTSRPD